MTEVSNFDKEDHVVTIQRTSWQSIVCQCLVQCPRYLQTENTHVLKAGGWVCFSNLYLGQTWEQTQPNLPYTISYKWQWKFYQGQDFIRFQVFCYWKFSCLTSIVDRLLIWIHSSTNLGMFFPFSESISGLRWSPQKHRHLVLLILLIWSGDMEIKVLVFTVNLPLMISVTQFRSVFIWEMNQI